MALTNEQLFDLIKDGNEDFKPVLWERLKSLAYMLSSRFYSQNKELCCSRGLEEWDVKQLSYIAYASLFETYSTDKKYMLSTAFARSSFAFFDSSSTVKRSKTGAEHKKFVLQLFCLSGASVGLKGLF